MTDNFKVEFGLKITGTDSAWSNIFHVGNSDAERMPALWVHPGSRRLHFRVDTTSQSQMRDGCDPVTVPNLNQYYDITLRVVGRSMKVYFDGTQVCSRTLNADPRTDRANRPFYVSNPWYNRANVILSNLRITNMPDILGPFSGGSSYPNTCENRGYRELTYAECLDLQRWRADNYDYVESGKPIWRMYGVTADGTGYAHCQYYLHDNQIMAVDAGHASNVYSGRYCVSLNQWNLAMNINPSDGHNFGWAAEWDELTNVGSASQSLTHDYLSSTVWGSDAQYIAIVRHDGTTCQAVKTWRLDTKKSLYNYFVTEDPGREQVTQGNHVYEVNPSTLANKDKDPIFAVDGNLMFNWHYSNNGARIALDSTYWRGGMPGLNDNDDDLHGLGNEFGATTKNGHGSSAWWHDVSQHQTNCFGRSCKVQGTDHGTHLSDGTKFGNYAIYVTDSNTISSGPVCTTLQNTMYSSVNGGGQQTPTVTWCKKIAGGCAGANYNNAGVDSSPFYETRVGSLLDLTGCEGDIACKRDVLTAHCQQMCEARSWCNEFSPADIELHDDPQCALSASCPGSDTGNRNWLGVWKQSGC